MNANKIIIYQLLPRLFSNTCSRNIYNGTIDQNGVGKLNDINDKVLGSIHELGVTHLWYTGVIEHATKTDYSAYGIASSNPHVVKGNAGSPYAIRDYYDIDPDLAVDVTNRRNEFEQLVQRTHKAGMSVIIDFVPNHVARQYHSDAAPKGVRDLGADDNKNMFFSPANNFFYITGQHFAPSVDMGIGPDRYIEYPAKATGNDCYNATPGAGDWYETVKLNYGVDPWNGSKHFVPTLGTWRKMLDILMYWASKGIDGFRCDMAHMVPVEFWQWAIGAVKQKYPHIIFIAEIYDVNLYHSYIHTGGFDYLYDKVTLYDTLCGVLAGQLPASEITKCWQTVDGMKEHMLNFLENHDEQRIASYQKAGNAHHVVPALVVSATLTTCPFMLYAGQELGEKGAGAQGFSGNDGRTSIFDYCSIPTVRRWYNNGKCTLVNLSPDEKSLRKIYQKIMKIATTEKAIARGSLFDLMYVNFGNLDPTRHYVYMRNYGKESIIIGCNFGPSPASIDIDVPAHAFDTLHIKPGTYMMTELVTRHKRKSLFTDHDKLHLDIEPYGTVLWKFKAN